MGRLSVCQLVVSSGGGGGGTQTGTHINKRKRGSSDGWRVRGLLITWILGVGQAQDGAGLGWTDASPKRNHRISSTKEERKGEERTKGQEAGGGRMRPEAKGGGRAFV